MRLLLLLLISGCGVAPGDPPSALQVPPSFCGDGIADPGEACDDGPDNSDSSADACRLDCRVPACGDGVADRGEDCDDGNPWGGDGCSPACVEETGALEEEPNDNPNVANPLNPGAWVRGNAPAGDIDCFRFQVQGDGWVAADVRGIDGAHCPADAVLSLHGPDGTWLAQGTRGEGGCAAIDPVLDTGARFLQAGSWSLCVQGLLGGAIPGYEVGVEVGEGSCDLQGLPIDPLEDPDADGILNRCDEDDDADGVADVDDNCPRVPNGPDMDGLMVDGSGWIKHWLTIGEWHGLETTNDCRPSLDNVLGDDAAAVPRIGDVVDDLPWLPWSNEGRRIRFLDRYGGDTPREVYAVTWIDSPIEQDVVLSSGVDDGYFAWLNGELVADVHSCQGTNVDQFQQQVTLEAGWNRLMFKVRDQGGGWGMFVRFLGPDGPLTDLGVSMTPDGPWLNDQTDLDGDGVGDVCDDTPAG